ncbi:MAG: endonuclease/exonuclease/phosphatase family protein [Luteolibacter sp.]
MRIVTWNLQHGGGKRIGAIVEALRLYSSDALVLSEFRNNPSGEILRTELKDMGYQFQASPPADARTNTVLIAAREPFEAVTFPGQMADPELGDFSTSVLLAKFPDLNIFGLYLPGEERKRPVFDFLLNLPAEYLPSDSMLIGDFNTGQHYLDEAGATFKSAEQFQELLTQGWIDAWRSRNPIGREFTWLSPGYRNGFRLDHAFVSPTLDQRITDVRYSHGEREQKITDHSVMLMELKPSPSNP